jgi:hypothetical protein
MIQIECRDNIGPPFWNRDLTEADAKPVLGRTERLRLPLS